MKRLLIILLSLALIAGSLSIIGTVSAATETEQTYSVGDIIEYGTYPQSRVTDGETLELLNSLVPDFGEWISYNYYTGSGEATDDGSMQPGDYMKYIDITQGEEKYRAVIFTDYRPKTTGSSHRAGDAFQDDNGYYTDTIYWFLFEPLKWRVLDPGSGLVFCASAVDSQAFNNYSLLAEGGYFGNADKTYYSNDYANSSIRFWLNNSFINTAFSEEQRQSIVLSENLDNSCPFGSVYDNGPVSDKVFLLSYSDIMNIDYGFNSEAREQDPARTMIATDYAKCQGIYDNEGCSMWWLRSPVSFRNVACQINYNGSECYGVYSNVICTYLGVCPAMRLDFVASGFQAPKVGDIIEYGTYPQSEVKDETTLRALNIRLCGNRWVSYGYYSGSDTGHGTYQGQMNSSDYMMYQDVVLSGEKYRAVRFTSYRPRRVSHLPSADESNQDDNGYYTDNVYWFRFEPLTWRVLDPADGLVICNAAIDSQPFNNYVISVNGNSYGDEGADPHTVFANNYENSSIRAWLNADFFNTAFSATQQDNIVVTDNLDNSCPFDSSYYSNPTSDKVFLLSFGDVTNEAYGFSPNTMSQGQDSGRMMISTDYAKCQGAEVHSDNMTWWLRTPNTLSYYSYRVEYNGWTNSGNLFTWYLAGVCPAMRLENLASSPAGASVGSDTEVRFSASVSADRVIRGEKLIWVVETPKDVAWLKFNCVDDSGNAYTSFYKYSNYNKGTTEVTIRDTDDTRIWTIPMIFNYSGTKPVVDQTWNIEYKKSGLSQWLILQDWLVDSPKAFNIRIGKNAAVLASLSSGYDPYTLVSVTAMNSVEDNSGYKQFTVTVTDDVSKIRITYDNSDTGKTKSTTYQATSTNVLDIDTDGGVSVWTIRLKVSGTVKNNEYTVQCRGSSWGDGLAVRPAE